MSTTDWEARPTRRDLAPLIQTHPRGRGFGILSRLARVEDVSGRHVRVDATGEQTTVLAFQRRDPDARHRRDDAAMGMLHFC